MGNLSIRVKLLILVCIPLISIGIKSFNTVQSKYESYNTSGQLLSLAKLAGYAGNLVHELQKERGSTAIFLQSGGQSYREELGLQRKNTDSALDSLNSFLDEIEWDQFDASFNEHIQLLTETLSTLGSLRQSVSSLDIKPGEVIGTYTEYNRLLLESVGQKMTLGQDVALTNLIASYFFFLQSKERAGIERAVVSQIFAKGFLNQADVMKFSKLVEAQDAYMRSFLTVASYDHLAYYKQQTKDPSFAAVADMRNIALTTPDNNGYSVSAPEWFSTITSKINVLKDIENTLASDLLLEARRQREESYRTLIQNASVSLSLIIFVLIACGFVIRSISKPIKTLQDAAKEVANGNNEVEVPVTGKDELGRLSVSFNSMVASIRDAAQKIAFEQQQTKEALEAAESSKLSAELAKDEALAAKSNAELALTEAEEAKAEALNAKGEAETSATEAEAAFKKAEASKEEAEKALKEAEASKAEALKAKNEAEASSQEAIEAKQRAEASKREAEVALKEAEAAKSEALKAKADADASAAEAMAEKEKASASEREALEAKASAEASKEDAETALKEAEAAKANAEASSKEALEAQKRAETSSQEALEAQEKAEKAKQESEAALKEAEAAKAEALNAKTEAEASAAEAMAEKEKASASEREAARAMQEALESKGQAERALAEADQAKDEAEKALKEAEVAKEEAVKAQAQAEASKSQVEVALQEAEVAKEQAEALKDQADQARVEIEHTQQETIKAREELEKSVELMLEKINLFANGDLTVRLPESSHREINRLFNGFNQAVHSVRRLIEDVSATVNETQEVVSSISSSSNDILKDVGHQVEQAIQIAAAAEEMTQTVSVNAENASNAASLSTQSGEVAREGGEIIRKAVDVIKEVTTNLQESASLFDRLEKSGLEIGKTTSVIEQIARQTKLLALNARIEAEHAAEKGSGFAVVAKEVGQLAEQTTLSTGDISDMIRSVQTDTGTVITSMDSCREIAEKGVSLADNALTAISAIGDKVSETVYMANQIAKAAVEQQTTSNEITKNIEGISQLTQRSQQRVGTIVESVDRLTNQTETLSKVIGAFKINQ